MQIYSLKIKDQLFCYSSHTVKFKIYKVFIVSKVYAKEYSNEVKPIHFLFTKVFCGIGHFILNVQDSILLLTHYVGKICYMEYSFPNSKLPLI